MSGLLSLLIALIVIGIFAYLLFYLLGRIPMPEPVRTVIVVLIALIILLYVVQRYSLLGGAW